MAVAVVTGSAGLVGSEACRFFAGQGLDIVGIDNDMRALFFGDGASTYWQGSLLERDLGARYRTIDADIRDEAEIEQLFRKLGSDIRLVVHAAAQPSHDWAARQPRTDFSMNAVGTLNLLESTRKYAPDAVFIFTSTNKVYGDSPNRLPFIELKSRWELAPAHHYADGIGEDMSIDQSLHSLFGASKIAADVLVQEYGRYFGMKTVCFRGGCLTGPGHAGTQLHGFLSYLMQCTATGAAYTVFGHGGKQVRDNIHSADLIHAFDAFFQNPRCGEVYDIGGGRVSNCSMLEAITICEKITDRQLNWTYSDTTRVGDHIWWVSDLKKFRSHYPNWRIEYDMRGICSEIFESIAHKTTMRTTVGCSRSD